jgi:hypothetical protein
MTMNRFDKFERGAAIISLDTEQLWGHLDLLSPEQFEARFPNAPAVHDRILNLLSGEGISATWTLVGALTLPGTKGPTDPRFAKTPAYWAEKIPAGNERTQPLWYARSFVERLQRAKTPQDLGMHGGISHLVWGDSRTSAKIAENELRFGMEALREIGIEAKSFVFPRDLEAHHAILRDGGIRCYRGRAPILSERLGFNLAGSLARAGEEVCSLVPPPIWPEEVIPGLWNVPASMSIYCLGATRSRFVPAKLRLERTKLGLDAAAKQRGIFHLAMHPENVAESDFAFPVFESMVHEICRRRDRGEIDTLSMNGAVERVAGVEQDAVVFQEKVMA